MPLLAATAAPPALADPIDAVRSLCGTTWYTVSVLNQRVGYAYRNVAIDARAAGGPELRIRQRLLARVELKGTDTPFTIASDLTSVYNANLDLREMVERSDEFGRLREVHVTIRGTSAEVTIRSGGTEKRETIALPDDFDSDLSLVLAVMRRQVTVGDVLTLTTFDPDLGKCDRHRIKVTDLVRLPDRRWAYVLTSTSSRLPVEVISCVAVDGTLVSFATPSLLNLSMEQATESQALATAAPLVLASDIPTNERIANFKQLELLKVRMRNGNGSLADSLPSSPRQSTTTERNGAVVVTTVARPFEGAAASLPIVGERFAPYLAASEVSQINDPAIQACLRRIIGKETNAREATTRIVMWVYDNLRKVRTDPRLVSAREVLDQMSGACTEHAILCGTLAAAAGIPAKLVAGVAYANGAFYYHAWNELYIGEWVEVDSAWGELTVDAGHIRMGDGPLDLEAIARTALGAGRSLGSLNVEILEYWVGDGPAPPAR